jgi:KDO2-lipid IV(A) lauroyltransferase
VPSLSLVAYRSGSALARALPEPVAGRVADGLGVLASHVARGRRRQVERNLARVLPAAPQQVRRRLVTSTFRSYARYWAESFRLPGTDAATLDAGIDVPGWPLVQAARAGGNGAILALPHLGGWEWAGFWVAAVQKTPITVVVEPLEPPELFEWFAGFRRSLGMQVVPLGPSAGAEVLRALRANEVVCLLCDRDIGGSGVDVEFFGERTTLPAGPVTLALRSGAPLFAVAVYYDSRGRRATVQPVSTNRTGGLRADVARVTQDLAHAFEDLIRVAPDQWHLLQPNWPSDRP